MDNVTFSKQDTIVLLELLEECLRSGPVGYYTEERERIRLVLERITEANLFTEEDTEGLKLLADVREDVDWKEKNNWDDGPDKEFEETVENSDIENNDKNVEISINMSMRDLLKRLRKPPNY